jgi:methionyl-tRNA formyltransferase
MLNVHHEVLPDYRNAQSVLWQLYNGSDETGYTIHRIANRIDAGAIVYQKRIRICFGESLAATVSATVAALYEASAEGLVTVLSDLTGYLERAQVQGAGQTYTTPTAKQMQKIRSEWARLRCRLS